MPVSSCLGDFSVHELERLGDCLYSQPFLKFVEDEHRGRARAFYFFARASGKLVAFTSAYIYETRIPFTFQLESFVSSDAAAELLEDAARYLVVNVPIRLRTRLFAESDVRQRELIDEIVEWSRERSLSAVLLPFVLGSDSELCGNLRHAGFAESFYEGDFYLPVQADNFDEFLDVLPKGPRKQFRNDINRFQRSGMRVASLAGLSGHAKILSEQHRALMAKYESDVELTEESFRNFQDLGEKGRVVAALQGEEIQAFAMSTYGHGVFHLLRYGRLDAALPDARLYGNLVYAESVRQAIELGCHRVHFGKASHRAKTLRGCLYEEGLVFALCLDSSKQARLAREFNGLDVVNRKRFEARVRGLD